MKRIPFSKLAHKNKFQVKNMIRNIETKDLQRVCEIYNHFVLTTHASFETEPVPVEEMQRRMRDYTSDYPWLIYEENSEVIGFCYASKWRPRPAYRFTAEVTIYLDKGHLSKGIGMESGSCRTGDWRAIGKKCCNRIEDVELVRCT